MAVLRKKAVQERHLCYVQAVLKELILLLPGIRFLKAASGISPLQISKSSIASQEKIPMHPLIPRTAEALWTPVN